MRFEFENKISVDISLEKSIENSFTWEIECMDASMIKVDFTNRSFVKSCEGKILASYSDESEFNPALSMIEDMSKTANTRLQNFIDSHSFLVNFFTLPVPSKG
jgi:tRNA A37 threonylcarbamoyladenosine dehydratase